MEETTVRREGFVHADYHQFWLASNYQLPTPDSSKTNGLVDGLPGAAIIHTGISSGPVNVMIEKTPEPKPVETAGWDEVVDVSIEIGNDGLRVSALMDDVPDSLSMLTLPSAGTYRIRVHARGRDTNTDLAVLEPCEDYLIQVWPAPLEPETVHKQTDRCGANIRLSATHNQERPQT